MSSRTGGVAVKRQMSTPSSNDAEIDQLSVQLNTSTDSGDYEVPPRLNQDGKMSDGGKDRSEESGRRARKTKQVTADARRILDRFFRIADEMSRRRQRRIGAASEDSPAEGSLYDASETEHQYAIVEEIFHDLLPTPYQPIGSDDEDREAAEAKEAQEFVDNFKRLMSTESSLMSAAEPDYVDCQMLISGQERKTTASGDASSAALTSYKPELPSLLMSKDHKGPSARHTRTRSPPSAVKYAVKHSIGAAAGAMTLAGGVKPVKVKAGKNKKKIKGIDGGEDKTKADGSSSSSTEDYEIPDVELLNRKKKSGFRLTIERVQQSFRRQGGTKSGVVGACTPTPSGRHSAGPGFLTGGVQRWSKTDVPLPAPPCDSDASGTLALRRDGKEIVLQRNGSDKSKMTNSSGSPGEIGHERARQPALTEGQVVGSDLEGGQTMKSRRPGVVRDGRKSGEDSEREKTKETGIFDGILRQFRKGSAKLRGRGSRARGPRSHSADTLSIRPLSKNDCRLLDRYESAATATTDTPMGQNWEQDTYETDGEVLRVRCLADVATPRLMRGSLARGHHSLRHKLTLDNLVKCQPRIESATGGGSPPIGGLLQDVERVCTPYTEISCDDIDSAVGPSASNLSEILLHSTSKPFHEKSEREKEELLEKIAEQLAAIADHYGCLDLQPHCGGGTQKKMSSTARGGTVATTGLLLPTVSENATSAKDVTDPSSGVQLDVLVPRETGDDRLMHEIVEPLPAVTELVQSASYGKFKQIVTDSVGGGSETTGWNQIARTFRLTQSAVQLAGLGTQVARQIKEMTLRYFEDRFADWIVGQGGWESMVEDTNTEQDSELD